MYNWSIKPRLRMSAYSAREKDDMTSPLLETVGIRRGWAMEPA